MKRLFLLPLLFFVLGLLSCTNNLKNNIPKDYKGIPYVDDTYKKGAQTIPGKIECKLFDLGGEGVGYHDSDSSNNGSGEYNYREGHCEGVSDYVCHFRINDGVDLSYTKEFLDFNHPNPFTPEREQGFIGWTNDGEWCNYTVNVTSAGTYNVSLLYSNNISSFKLLLNGKLAGEYSVPVKTDSYHTWNLGVNLGTISIPNAGLNVITLQYNGGMNYAYLELTE